VNEPGSYSSLQASGTAGPRRADARPAMRNPSCARWPRSPLARCRHVHLHVGAQTIRRREFGWRRRQAARGGRDGGGGRARPTANCSRAPRQRPCRWRSAISCS